MRKWKKINGFLILFITFFSACAGFSSWNLNPSIPKGFDINIDNSKNKVAYFKVGDTKREFTTVAGALKAAADRKQETLVVVNPDTTGNVSITDCTIADKVTLIINYKAVDNYHSPSSKDFVNDYIGDKDGGSFGDTAGSKSKIKLSGARKIESGGSLIIGGETGQYNISLQGGTRGSCAELNFVEGGSIDCSGKIISYGFIHDYLEGTRGENEAAITIHDGGSVAEPLTIYTWPGGSSASGLKDKRIFPCNVFDLINIRPPMKFEYGSTFTGAGKVYTSGLFGIGEGYHSAEASIIARDNQEGFLQLQNGKDANNGTGISGSVLFDANDADIKKTSYNYTSHKTKIKTAGDFSFSGVAVKVGASLDTKEGYLPISGIFDIEVGKGFGEVKYPTKLLPGASLKIGEGAYFKLDNNFIAYQSVENSEGYKRWNYSFSSPATIQNSGTREICSGFDGQIFAKNRNGKMIVGSGYSNVSNCRDRDTTATIGAQGDEHNSVFAFYNGANRNRLAQRYAIDGTTSYISKGNENAVANRTYTSSATSDGKYGWTYNNEYKSYPIVIDTNGNDSAVDSNGQKYIENYGSGTTLSNLTSKDPDKTFDGFYYDQACTKALDKNESGLYYVNPDRLKSYLTNNCLKVYAKWISGYTVHFKYRKYSTDHLSKYTEIDSSTIIKKADLGDTYSLNPNNDIKLSPDYYFEYNGNNNSSIPANQFNCYYDVVSSIQVVHRSSDGTSTTTNITSDNISNLSSWPTSDWKRGDTIEVEVEYTSENNTCNLSIAGADLIDFNKTESYRVNGISLDWYKTRNINITTNLSCTNNWKKSVAGNVNNPLEFTPNEFSSHLDFSIYNKNTGNHTVWGIKRDQRKLKNTITFSVKIGQTILGLTKKDIEHMEEV